MKKEKNIEVKKTSSFLPQYEVLQTFSVPGLPDYMKGSILNISEDKAKIWLERNLIKKITI